MSTLDRYIVRTFLINFAILFAVLMILFAVVDVIVNLDEFIEAGQHRSDQYGLVVFATLYSIADYYGPVVVLMYVFFSGLLVVGAMGFTLSSLHRGRELTTMVASGLSLYRVAAPVLVTGIILNALAIPCQELLIPKFAPKLARKKNQIKYDTIERFPIYYATDGRKLFSARKFDASKGQLKGVTILDRDAGGQVIRRISATQAIWQESDQGQEQGWKLVFGHASVPTDPGLLYQKPEPIEFVRSELSPTVLLSRRATNYPRLLPLEKLQQMQQSEAMGKAQRHKVTQIIWSRFSLLVMNVLILLMGLSFFLVCRPANMMVQAVKAAVVCLGAWGSGLLMLEVSLGSVNPVTAAWLPVVIYLPISFVLIQCVKT